MRHRNPNMLVYIGMADACAAAAEYLKFPRDEALQKDILQFKRYLPHPTHHISAGCYTDDTEMSVANARVLCEEKTPYTPIMFANAYVREFVRGGRRKGYSRAFQEFLESGIKDGEELLAKIHPHSTKNGAAMRAVPIGVLRTVADVLRVAETQAQVTHDTRDGIFSARAIALMSHFALYEDTPLTELPEYCLEHLPFQDILEYGRVFTLPWLDKPVRHTEKESVAIATVHAVIHLLTHSTSLMDILRKAILWGGDTDTVAAITWGIASARYQKEQLPIFMKRDLERGYERTGAHYLSTISHLLMQKYS